MLWADVVSRTQAECKQDILTMLDEVGFTATSWQEGSVALGCVEIGALVWSKLTDIAVALKNANLLRTSTGAAFDAYVESQYDETRVAASSAVYLKLLTCAAGEGPHSIDIGDVIATNGEYTYTNIAGNSIAYPYTLAGGASVTLMFQADTPGADPTVAASEIDQLQTTFAGVTISGGSLVTAGYDQESEPRCAERCLTKWSTLTEGETIVDLVRNICLNADSTIARVEVDDENPRGDYTFDAYVAGTSGTVAEPARAAAAAALALRFFGSATSSAIAATEYELDITGTVYYDPSASAADVEDAVDATLLAWFATIPLGGFTYGVGLANIVTVGDIENAIRSAQINGTDCVRTVKLTVPAADETPAEFNVVVQGTIALTYTAAAS